MNSSSVWNYVPAPLVTHWPKVITSPSFTVYSARLSSFFFCRYVPWVDPQSFTYRTLDEELQSIPDRI